MAGHAGQPARCLVGGVEPEGRRNVGFWVFLTSNVLWGVWGWHDGAYALIALQLALAALNIRGVVKTEKAQK